MPIIRLGSDLRRISIESHELLTDKYMLFKALEKGIKSLEEEKTYSDREVYEELDKI